MYEMHDKHINKRNDLKMYADNGFRNMWTLRSNSA